MEELENELKNESTIYVSHIFRKEWQNDLFYGLIDTMNLGTFNFFKNILKAL